MLSDLKLSIMKNVVKIFVFHIAECQKDLYKKDGKADNFKVIPQSVADKSLKKSTNLDC